MPPTFTYSLQGTAPNQYLRLTAVGGTFEANYDLVLNTDVFSGQAYPVKEITNNYVFYTNTSARSNLHSVVMNNLTTISGNNTFHNCTSLTSASFPNLSTFSGRGTFFGCTSLTDFTQINLGTTITSYPDNTFYGCRFVNITLPSHITSLGSGVFQYNNAIQIFSGPSLTSIGTSTFSSCTSLTDFTQINLGTTIISYPNNTFSGCKFVNITLPSHIISLGNSVFTSNTALQSFSGPNLISIGTGTFNVCTSLTDFTKINLGTTITSYPDSTFYGCSFVNITLPSHITSLDFGVFSNNIALQTFYGPTVSTLTNGPFGIFDNCIQLQTCVLGSMSTFPDYMFRGCSVLKNLYIRSLSAPSPVGTGVFTNTSQLQYIFISQAANWTGFTAKTSYKVPLPIASTPKYTTTTNSVKLSTSGSTSGMPSGYIVPYYTYKWYNNDIQQLGTFSQLPIQNTIESNDNYIVKAVDPLNQESESPASFPVKNVIIGVNHVKIN